ncbi:flavodoxin [Campylobacter sp. FMV-PI01]|uniref:Flavodoxin n=1 Tax=Campylobacter portucalensis TaxID=2608384 RepID=A0A6L5WHV6_9BACT|nr:flavodoxin domain-containing protein [Campylobacter portucalensis]MSN96780.1 flavodoxin [Campylobacter portucalensis]
MVGIFYGSSKGSTRDVANFIGNELDAKIFNIKDVKSVDEFSKFSTLIFASSSYGFGELQEDWLEKINLLDGVKFSDKKVALIGVGGLARHADSFCSSLVEFLPKIKAATRVGSSDLDGYEIQNSSAFINGKFIGLCVDFKGDENWQKRAKKWCENLKNEI